MTSSALTRRDRAVGAGRGAVTGSPGAIADLAVPLLVSPLLLFPRGLLPLVGLVVILGLWLARWVVWRMPFQSNPLALAMLLFLVMAAQALYSSTDLSLSMPKLYGIVLGVAVYYGAVSFARNRRAWWVLAAGLMVAAVVVAGMGLVSTAWLTSKLPGVTAIYSMIPRLVSSVPSSFGTIAGIHPNEVGGTLAFLLPLPLALILWSVRRGKAISRRSSVPSPVTHSRPRPITYSVLRRVALLTATALVAGAVLVLTVSRSALMGAGVAVGLLVGLRWRRVGLLLGAAVLMASAAVAAIGPQRVYEWVVQADQASRAGGSTLVSRQEVWNRATYMIQDFPFTGIGLNTFPRVLDTLYPSFLAGPDARIPHAHNIYLQTAVDLGLAGLMAFVGLWLIVGWQAVQAYRRADGPLMKGAIAGLGAGCVAYLVYGLTDAITLGAKPLVLLWVMVGLIVSAARGEWVRGRVGEGERAGRGDSEPRTQNSELRTLPARSSVLSPGWKRWAREIGATLWWLYWAVAILFAVMAYLVDAIAISGWVP